MKKAFLLFILTLALISAAACGEPVGGNDVTQNEIEADSVNPDLVHVKSVAGLNEQIYLTLEKPTDGNYVISYKATNAEEYTVLDSNLIVERGNSLDCYILGLSKGSYDVKIELGEGDSFARTTIKSIDVEKQDRSGYAHFNREEGIGGYNNDGTVKEGAKIIYLTNENKNTVTLDINGTTYTGIVEILKANEQMNEPLIIRVLDMVTTNQWIESKDELILPESADVPNGYFENLFSNECGDNVSGLPVIVYASSLGKRYEYVTTPNGISHTLTANETETDNSSLLNLIEVNNASNITIEGIGKGAGFYQFGISFNYSDSIEVKNITMESYPEDALAFLSYGDFTLHGGYWIHNNTFNEGKNAWDSSSGDGTIDFADINHVTVAYNKFYQTGKTMLFSGWEYDSCLNITLHHNYYCEVEQRLPLSRNSNIHSYNNYYDDCYRGLSPRTSTYVFAEANYFSHCTAPYYFSDTETWGSVKSWNEIYDRCGKIDMITVATDREQYVENTCTHEGRTDYTRFDIDPELFYYDTENKCSDVELMLKAEDVPAFVKAHAGAGILVRMEFEN